MTCQNSLRTMATFSLSMDISVPNRGDGDVDAFCARLREAVEHHYGYRATVQLRIVAGSGAIVLQYYAEGDALERSRLAYEVQAAQTRMSEAFERDVADWRYRRDQDVCAFAHRDLSQSMVTLRIPMLGADAEYLTGTWALDELVRSAVELHYPYVPDRARLFHGTTVSSSGDSIVIRAADVEVASRLATAYILAPRAGAPPAAVVRPQRPVWPIASAAIAALSFGLCWTPLRWWTISILGIATTLIAGAALWIAPRRGASRLGTTLGVAPAVTLVGFAVIYALAMLHGASIQLNQAATETLREPLLLSLSVLTTVGVLDFNVRDWTRGIVYLQMLVFAALAGGAGAIALRAASRRFDEVLREVARSRGGDDSPNG